MSFLGGLDLCVFPAGTAPDGVKPNFTNPPTYAPAVLGVSVVLLLFASLFTGCRLIANWKKLTWTDHFNTWALVFSVAQSGIVLSQLRYARHMWDIPACWFFGDYPKAIMITPALMFSKASLLLLFLQIFQIQNGYYNTPDPGQSWDDVMMSKKPADGIYWGIVQSALAIILDLHIFILPMPAIAKLQISSSKRNQLVLVFSTASLGIVANILSLAYRVLEYKHMEDATWHLFAILLCAIVEINIAIIVCSVPGVAKFLRMYAKDWSPIQSLRSKVLSPGNSSNTSDPNLRNNHGWPSAQESEQSSDHDMEIVTHKSTSSSLQHNDISDGYVDIRERWQVDPYLDTRGSEYSWMYKEDPETPPAVSPLGKVHVSQSTHDTLGSSP